MNAKEYADSELAQFRERFPHRNFIELRIVGALEGATGEVIWRCALPADNMGANRVIHVRPHAPLAQRQAWWKVWDRHLNDVLIVQYDGYTVDRQPKLPVAVAMREQGEERATWTT